MKVVDIISVMDHATKIDLVIVDGNTGEQVVDTWDEGIREAGDYIDPKYLNAKVLKIWSGRDHEAEKENRLAASVVCIEAMV